MNTHPTNQYLNRERLTDLARFAVPDGHDLWPRIEQTARTSPAAMPAPRPGLLSLGLSRAWTAVGILFIAATFAALGFGLAVLVLSNGHDQVPAAPVTPTPAAATATPIPAPVSLSSQALPSTFEEYRHLAEEDPAGRETMVEQAIETLSADIRKDPSNAEAYVKRGVAYALLHYHRGGRGSDESLLEQPIQDFTKAIDLDPTNTDAYIGRGETYSRWKRTDRANQDYDRAIQLFSRAISIDSSDVDTYIGRAKVYGLKEEFDKAIRDYNVAVELEPDNPNAYYGRAVAYSQMGSDVKAIEDYDMVILLDPNHVHAYNNRGGRYRRIGKLDMAIQDYDKVISLSPNYRWAYGNRGAIFTDRGEYDRAIQDFNKAIEIRPYSAAYIGRGHAYLFKGEYDNAIQDYSSAIDRFPDYAQTYVDRGYAYYKKGEYDEAIQDFDKAIGIEINNSEAYFGMGLVYASLDDDIRARGNLNKALSLGHDSGEVEAALKELDTSTTPTPPTPESWVSENGFIQFTTGDDPLDDPLPGTHQWCIHPSNVPKEPAGPWLVPTKLPEGMEQTDRDQMSTHSLLRAFRSSTDRISMGQELCAIQRLGVGWYRTMQIGDRTAYVTAKGKLSADGSTRVFDSNAASTLIMDIGYGVVSFNVFGSVTVDELVSMAASLVPEELTEAEQGPYPQAVLDALGTGFGPVYVPSKLPDGYEMFGQLQARQEALAPKTARLSYVRASDGYCVFRLNQAGLRRQFPDVVQQAQRGDETSYTTTDETGQTIRATAKWGTSEIDGVTIYAQEFSAQPRNEYTDVYFQSQGVWFNLTISTSPYCDHTLEMVAEIATSLQPLQP